MASELEPLLNAIAEKIKSMEICAGIEVFPQKPGNLAQQIVTAIETGTGVVMIVAISGIGRRSNNTRKPIYDPLKLYVRIVENAFMNGDRPHAMELAERVDAELKYWVPELAGVRVPGGHQLMPGGEMQPLHIVPSLNPEDAAKLNLDGWDIPFVTIFAPTPAT